MQRSEQADESTRLSTNPCEHSTDGDGHSARVKTLQSSCEKAANARRDGRAAAGHDLVADSRKGDRRPPGGEPLPGGKACLDDHAQFATCDYADAEPSPSEAERIAENKHFKEVCCAFARYECMGLKEVCRMEKHFLELKPHEHNLLIEDVNQRILNMKDALALNQAFLDLLISQDWELIEHGAPQGVLDDDSNSASDAWRMPVEPGCAIEDGDVSSMNMFKVRSTLKQFVREWSSERAEERATAFDPLIASLEKYLNLADFKEKFGRLPWVLCPGSGLGRLAYDVLCKGYSCQGNEFSYFMLLGSNFILNHILEPNSITLKPFVLNSSNRREHNDHLQAFTIPDVCAAETDTKGAHFSMCAGDFIEVYGPQRNEWDAVLTCFFLDTARNVITYIHTIANLLPPGGLWSNMGPLLYHFADSPTEYSIELSWEEIRRIIVHYFEIKEERWIDSFYTTPPRSMLQALYHCIFFVGIRNDKPVPASWVHTKEDACARACR